MFIFILVLIFVAVAIGVCASVAFSNNTKMLPYIVATALLAIAMIFRLVNVLSIYPRLKSGACISNYYNAVSSNNE